MLRLKMGSRICLIPPHHFVVDSLDSPGVVFSVKQSKYDKSYIIAPIAFARNLFGEQGFLSSLELRLKAGSDLESVKREMQQMQVINIAFSTDSSSRMIRFRLWLSKKSSPISS